MDLKMVKLNCLTLGSCKMSLFPKKVEYPFKKFTQAHSLTLCKELKTYLYIRIAR